MTYNDALKIIDDTNFSIAMRLRAHGVLFAKGSSPHQSFWCDEAADYIEKLENLLRDKRND